MKHFIFFLTIVFLCPWPFFLLAENQPEVWHRTDSLVLLPSEDTISWTDEYAVFSVLRNLHEDSVQCLWGFAENDTISTAVLTDGLYTSSGGILLATMPRDYSQWSVYAYHGGIRLDSTKIHTLRLGDVLAYRNDSVSPDTLYGRVEMEELAYFGRNVSRLQAASFQAYLALKYGITLDYAAYLSPAGDTLWHPLADKEYYHRVVGIGHDTIYEWQARKSQSKEDALLSLYMDTLEVGEYVIAGDDDEVMYWAQESPETYSNQRIWRVRQHLEYPRPLYLSFSLSDMAVPSDSIWLSVLDSNGVEMQNVLPDSVLSDSVCYFTLQRSDSLVHLRLNAMLPDALPQKNQMQRESQENFVADTDVLYDAGNRTIIISGFPQEQQFDLFLYDTTGKLYSVISSLNPVDVSVLPYTVSHIVITAGDRIVGSVSAMIIK